MRIVGIDTETALIKHQVTPPIVCMTTWDSETEEYGIYNRWDYTPALKQLLLDDDVLLVAHNAQFDFCVFVADAPELLPLVNSKFKKGLIICSKLAEIMLNSADAAEAGEINGSRFMPSSTPGAKGSLATKNSLAGCVMNYLRIDLTRDKESDLRISYWQLRDVPVAEWSTEAAGYAKRDAMYHAKVFMAQTARADKLSRFMQDMQILADLPRQTYCDFILGVMAGITGVQVYTVRGKQVSEGLVEQHDEVILEALEAGIFYEQDKKVRGYAMSKSKLSSIVKETADLILFDMPLTDKGTDISTTSQSLEKLYEALDLASDTETKMDGTTLNDDELARLADLHTILKSYQDAQGRWKEKATFVDALTNARLNPDSSIRFKYNALVETGRTSSSSPNMQNLPREGETRSCIVPGKNKVFIQADYSAAELRTLAQVHLNEGRPSKLAIAYQKNPDLDPHLYTALEMLKVEGIFMSYEEGKLALKNKEDEHHKNLKSKRQMAKAANFGYAGGLGAVKFITYAAGLGVKFTLEEARRLKADWLDVWEEMKDYFQLRGQVTKLVGELSFSEIQKSIKAGDYRPYSSTYVFPVSKRARFLRTYTIASNTAFQGLAADCAKESLILIWNECLFDRESPLYGCFPKLFIHDEFILTAPFAEDTPENRRKVTAAADRLSQLMVQGFNAHCPDIPCIAEPCVSMGWYKAMESTRKPDGTLTIWGLD